MTNNIPAPKSAYDAAYDRLMAATDDWQEVVFGADIEPHPTEAVELMAAVVGMMRYNISPKSQQHLALMPACNPMLSLSLPYINLDGWMEQARGLVGAKEGPETDTITTRLFYQLDRHLLASLMVSWMFGPVQWPDWYRSWCKQIKEAVRFYFSHVDYFMPVIGSVKREMAEFRHMDRNTDMYDATCLYRSLTEYAASLN